MSATNEHEDGPVLVVDLDGTLIQSDTLYECFWRALARSRHAVPEVMRGLAKGRAVLKRRLAELADLDPELLPYNQDVLDYILKWRKSGGRVALVTAADQSIADSVAGYLGLFDEAVGSDGQSNLKGQRKAHFLRGRYDNGFAYMGDSSADLFVWKGAQKAIAVNVPSALERQVKAQNDDVEVLPGQAAGLAYLNALRPHQWSKNTLVFLPVLAAQNFEPMTLLMAFLAFAAFCLVSSAGYVMNDLMDLRADRAHPRKSARPFASGKVPIAHGTVMVPMLLFGGLMLAAFAGWATFWIIATYFALTTLYSLALKRHVIADICTLAGLYTLRIIAGGLATGLLLSVWLLAFSMFLFFCLAAIKRQAELVDMKDRGVATARGRGYTVDDLPMLSQIAVASGFVAVLVLALYINAPTVQEHYSSPWLLWGICLILLYWISKLALETHRGRMHDDPIVYALSNHTSQICMAIMLACAVGASVL